MGLPQRPALFVYYRVAQADAAAAEAAAKQCLRDTMAAHPDLHARLWRRPDAGNGQVTVMETFESAEGIDDELAASIEQRATSALAPWLIGVRHVEVFVPI